MQDEKNKTQDNTGTQDGSLGRTDHKNDSRDISAMDQQEGNLEHGKKGGNFDSYDQTDASEKEK